MSVTQAIEAGNSLASRGCAACGTSGQEAQVAHLLSQVAFLHREVERLEELTSTVRTKSLAEARELTSKYEETIEHKNAEIERLQQLIKSRGDVDDPQKRCKLLEKQLAAVNSEKSVASMERAELQVKLRKLQVLLRTTKQEAAKAQGLSEESNTERSCTIAALKMTIAKLAQECDRLNKELDAQSKRKVVVRASSGTMCERSCTDIETQTLLVEQVNESCQVCTLQCTPGTSGEEGEGPHSLALLLEEKTRESDQLRGALEDLSAMQRDALLLLETTKKQLANEMERRKMAMEDAENLSLQLRAVQQRCSDQTAAERAMCDKIRMLGDERQKMLVEKSQIERDRDHWEEQLRQYEADVAQLSATKNHSNRQLSSLANENENLRAELLQLSEREAGALYAVKAKDMEVQEILAAYQKSAQEIESLVENQRFLERELDNARAALASKEETVVFLQEQVRSLRLREQQLTIDIQALEYENENHHQRLARGDQEAADLDAKCTELTNLLHVKEQCIEELHQSLSELSKQVIVKDNESLLLRQRCDSLIADINLLRTSLSAEKTKVRDLETSNAHLVAREVLSVSDAAGRREQVQAFEDERRALKAVLEENERITAACDRLRESNNALEGRLTELEKSLQESIEAKERLHRIVLDQNKALSRLSQ